MSSRVKMSFVMTPSRYRSRIRLHSDAHGALAHDRNNLECRYCCIMAETSIAGVKRSSCGKSASRPT